MQSSILEKNLQPNTLDYWIFPNYEIQVKQPNIIRIIPDFHIGIRCQDHPDLIYCNPVSWRSHFLETHLLGFPEEDDKIEP